MKNLITKAVVLAAGRGTRFLPYTKSSPKEMIAVVDKPAMQYIVEEIASCGIKDVLFVISKEKNNIIEHFKPNTILENFLNSHKKNIEVELVNSLGKMINVHCVYQEVASGSGAAVLLAEKFACGEPVAVLNGDDIMYTSTNSRSVIGQLCDCYARHNKTVIGVQPVPLANVTKVGVIDIETKTDNDYLIKSIIEKPQPEQAPSLLGSLGRYVISGDFYSYIRRTPVAKNGELQFTDALNLQASEQGIYAYDFSGKRYDTGDKLGYMIASTEYALRHPSIGTEYKQYLIDLVKQFK